jgi:RNA polymerase sigma-70 factor (ECF subfamily)
VLAVDRAKFASDTLSTHQVIAGEDIAIVELWLESPPEQPPHCPPALTPVHFHDGHTVRRIASHYASRP